MTTMKKKTDKEFKKEEITTLMCLLDKGSLEEVETIFCIEERNGIKFARIEKTFKVNVKGKITHDIYDTTKVNNIP